MSISFSILRAQTYKNVQTFNNFFNNHPNDVVDFISISAINEIKPENINGFIIRDNNYYNFA